MAKNNVPIDKVIGGCLDGIRRGEFDSLGILADYLEDQRHYLAKRVRGKYAKWLEVVRIYKSGYKPRRNRARWEEIALWTREIRFQVGKLFGRKWKRLPLEVLQSKNRHLIGDLSRAGMDSPDEEEE